MVRHASPERTCVGCRRRVPASELLRVVAVDEEAGHSLRVDPVRRMPGRGANLHPDPACFALAVRRRAFGRALRITGLLDHGELAEHLQVSTTTPVQPDPARVASKVGRPT